MVKRYFPYTDKDMAVASIQALVSRNLENGLSRYDGDKLIIESIGRGLENEIATVCFDDNMITVMPRGGKDPDRGSDEFNFLMGLIVTLEEYYSEVIK